MTLRKIPAESAVVDRQSREIDLLGEISRLLDRSLDLREVAAPMLEALSTFMGMKYATLTLLNRNSGEVLIEASHGLSAQQARQGRYRLGEGATGQVAQTGQPIVIPRTSESPLAKTMFPSPRPLSVCAGIVIAATSVGGSLNCRDARSNSFSLLSTIIASCLVFLSRTMRVTSPLPSGCCKETFFVARSMMPNCGFSFGLFGKPLPCKPVPT